jgi:serine/threonine protein kinase
MADHTQIHGFTVIQKLGSGGYGEIFAVRSADSSDLLALKTENLDSRVPTLSNELHFLKLLPPEPCFPRVVYEGSTQAVKFFVMPLFGPSVGAIRRLWEGQHFSLPTICRVALETLAIIEKLHSAGIVHCDIKPDNFLLNQASVGGFVLIDFGLSSRWRSPETHRHIESRTSDGFRGTLRYGSTFVHKLCEPARRDDVISWFYSIVEIAKGKLPWKDVQDNHLCMSCKQTITAEKLCAGLPQPMQTIWNSIRTLEFEEEPDYALIKRQIEEMAHEIEFGGESQYDWETRPEMMCQLTPFPELFDKNLMKAQARTAVVKRKKEKCRIA